MKSWADIGLEIEITRDGSPTLRLLQSVKPEHDRGESMHHSAGACGETILVYGKPARLVLEQVARPSFLIVGLGLGYIELCIAKEALLLGRSSGDIEKITSFESVPELREFFFCWLWDQSERLSSEVKEIYDEALAHVLQGSTLDPESIKEFLRPHFPLLEEMSGALTPDVRISHRYHGIMYDAYSSKTTPYLWSEEFLTTFFTGNCAESAMVTTYSHKSELKKALVANGFQIFPREGFYGKRKSTLALRSLNCNEELRPSPCNSETKKIL